MITPSPDSGKSSPGIPPPTPVVGYSPASSIVLIAWLGLLVMGGARAMDMPALSVIQPGIAVAHPAFVRQRDALLQERKVLLDRTGSHNKLCNEVDAGSAADASCSKAFSVLITAINSHVQASMQYNGHLLAAEAQYERIRIINGMNALAKRLDWSVDKRMRLNNALSSLDADGDDVSIAQVRSAWQDILARGQDKDLMLKASKGDGPGFPGAGTQSFNDCAIFALANAAGLPYGVAAARAAELISQGEWRDAADRANPQNAIEKGGLNGGEVVMLAEAFGQAEVVRSSDFAEILKKGRPILVNVMPEGGKGGHEVVLTKTFQHGGENWYEMVDSNQGPQQRRYLSGKELNTILQENGVAFRPEPGTVPKLLR